MAGRFLKSMVTAVDPVAIIELLRRLANTHLVEIGIQVDFGTDNFVEPSAPHCHLHLIVRILNAGIEDVDLSSLKISPNIAIPEIAVN